MKRMLRQWKTSFVSKPPREIAIAVGGALVGILLIGLAVVLAVAVIGAALEGSDGSIEGGIFYALLLALAAFALIGGAGTVVLFGLGWSASILILFLFPRNRGEGGIQKITVAFAIFLLVSIVLLLIALVGS